jgi:hypothetical protein
MALRGPGATETACRPGPDTEPHPRPGAVASMGLLAGSVFTDYQIHLGNQLIVVVAVNVRRRGARACGVPKRCMLAELRVCQR